MVGRTKGAADASIQVEFGDRLRGYRFAAAVRRADAQAGIRVWHTHKTVVVGLVGHASDANRALFREAAAISD